MGVERGERSDLSNGRLADDAQAYDEVIAQYSAVSG